jgi:hypothetical protein
MGLVLLVGGFIGSTFGVLLFTWLKTLGQIDLVIRLSYVAFLGIIGALMFVESVRAMVRRRQTGTRRRLHEHMWVHGLPFKMRFRKSKLYISALLSARCCRSASASWSASWPPSWASAAAS